MRGGLALAFGLLAGLLCVALAFGVGQFARNLMHAETGRYLSRMALEFRERLDDTLAHRRADLELVARTEGSPQNRRERIEEIARARGFTWVGFIDASGRVRTASGRVRTTDQSLVDVALPVDGGRGVIAAQLDLTWARSLRGKIEASGDPALGVELMLVARDGTVLIGPAGVDGVKVEVPPTAHSGVAALLQRWPDGVHYLIRSSVPRSEAPAGWSVIARTRADVALAPIDLLQRALLWAGLALALLGIFVGWVLATRHARPLEALTRAAQAIASGNDRAELPPLDDNQEVTDLAEALRSMLSRLRMQAESLREAQERLQRRVHERTAELVKAQAQLQLEVADATTARDELARAHEHLALALEASGLALWDLDVAAQRISLSDGWIRMLGGPAVETHLSLQAFAEVVPAEARTEVWDQLQAALSSTTPEFRLEHPVVQLDGAIIRVAAHGRVIAWDADGRPRRLSGIYRRIL
jgi:PAS domain-containing protein